MDREPAERFTPLGEVVGKDDNGSRRFIAFSPASVGFRSVESTCFYRVKAEDR